MIESFIKERIYFKNVSPKTIAWYRDSFKAFEGVLVDKQSIGKRIMEMRERGVCAISINTWLRCINAYFRWLHSEGHSPQLLKIPRLKEEQKVIEVLNAG